MSAIPELADSSPPSQAQSIIVIHPGSMYLRIGRASDLNPHTELHLVARRINPGGSRYRDTILPPLVTKPFFVGSLSSYEVQRITTGNEMIPLSFPNHCVKHAVFLKATFIDLKDVEPEMDNCRLQLSHTLQSCLMTDGQRRYATPPQQISAFNKRTTPETISPTGPEWVKFESEVVVGDEVLNIRPDLDYNIHIPIKRGDLNLHSGIGGSITAVIADLETIWKWVIENKLKIPLRDLKNYRAVLIVPDIYNRQHLKEMTSLIFELGFSSCFLLQDHVAATFGAGLGAACVIDCGHGKTSVSCVEDGITHPATRVRLPYGGGDITQCLLWLLNKCSFPYKEINPDQNQLDAVLLERLKRDICHVDLDVCGCREKNFVVRQPKSPVLKYTIQVGDECMIAPLGLFMPELFALTGAKSLVSQKRSTGDPSDPHDADYLRETGRKGTKESQEAVGGENIVGNVVDEEIVDIDVSGETEFIPGPGVLLSLDQAILQSIQRCSTDDLKRKMYSCILVVGGGLKFKGISTWLQNKISLQVPYIYRAEQMDIVTAPKEMDPVMTAWKGAAIMACLESAHELWITREEWEKYSVKILRERAPFIW